MSTNTLTEPEDFRIEAANRQKMPRQGLNRLSVLRAVLVGARRVWLTKVFGMTIHPTAQISLSARLDRTYPRGVRIGERSYIAFEACILTHDFTRGLYTDTVIGDGCFIGGRSLILPGVRVGDGAIVGAGSVVSCDVPARSVVVGNPARVIHENIDTVGFGRFVTADATEARISQTLVHR